MISRITTLMLMAMVCTLVACGQNQAGESGGGEYPPPPEGMLAINLGAEPQSMDPSIATDLLSAQVLSHLYEPLARLDEKGVAQPALAESWDISEDFKTWTFHLRDDNTWHNGEPVTAHDFIYAYQRVMDPALASTYAMMMYNIIEGGQEYYSNDATNPEVLGIKAIDDHTLEIKLNFPAPYFATMLNHQLWFPLHRETIEAHGDQWVNPENYVANGPFTMKDYFPKDKIILEKYQDYYAADEVPLDELHFLMIDDGNTQMAAYVSGTLHITDLIPPREAPRWRDKPDYHSSPMIGVYYVSFNHNVPPFDNPDVRKAFSLAINRQEIVDKIVIRGELPSTGFVPHALTMPNGEDFRDMAHSYFHVDNYEEAARMAKEQLANAGYAVAGQPGEPLPRIEYIYNQDYLHEDIAQYLQYTWKDLLGADVQLERMEWVNLLSRGKAGDFMTMRSSWIGDYLDPMTFLEIFQTGHGQNRISYSNPRYDELLELANTETNWEKRAEYLVEAERILIEEDAAIAPIFEYTSPVLIRPGLEGVVFTPLGNVDLRGAYWEMLTE